MKPRLNAPLTPEDFAIWDRIADPYGIKPGIPLWGYIESDRRDADLMYNITLYPQMLGTLLAQSVNPHFEMPRPLARIALKFMVRLQ